MTVSQKPRKPLAMGHTQTHIEVRPSRSSGYATQDVKHDLYKTGDPDAPEEIKDGNGEVAVDLCKRCGKAEVELLDTQCSGSKK